MPRINAHQDPWVKKVVGFLKRCPGLTIPEAMKLANFMPQEIVCKSKQMWIYRQWNKLTEERNVTGNQRNIQPTMGDSKVGVGGGGNGNSDSNGGGSGGR
jgi:uncharacterized membrane protein